MRLIELKALMAASLLGGCSKHDVARSADGPGDVAIEKAVRAAQAIWEETIKQDREDR